MRPSLLVPAVMGGAPSPGALGRALLEERFPVWFDTRDGVTNQGSDAASLSLLGSASLHGDGYVDVPDATSGVLAAGFGGDVTVPWGTGNTGSVDQRFWFAIVDLSAVSGSVASLRHLFANQASSTATAVQVSFVDGAGASDFTVSGRAADGTTTKDAGDASIAGVGRCMVYGRLSWFGVNLVQCGVIRCSDQATLASIASTSAAGLADSTLHDDMVWGAGYDGVAAVNGIDGTRDLHVYGGGFHVATDGVLISTDNVTQIAAAWA